MPFHSNRPLEAANIDAQYGQITQEAPAPLVNLAVESIPPSRRDNDPIVASMLLAGITGDKDSGGFAGEEFLTLAADKRTFESALKTEFPEKYKLLKDNAKNLRLEMCLPKDASLEQIAEKLYKLRSGQISRYSCRGA